MPSTRRFNTEGPVRQDMHYCLPPLDRLDAEQLLELVADQRYFVLHAPRQTGKTSALEALAELLEANGRYRCQYVNVEVGQSAREDVAAAMQAILSHLALEARLAGDDLFDAIWPAALERGGPHSALTQALAQWAVKSPKPLVLLIDEIDALIGDTLLAVLRQLRAGYALRPTRFPQSVILCGVRDIRDYRIVASSEKSPVAGGSAFNIAAESLRLGDFDEGETRALLAQHTEETGQPFTEAALATVWQQTCGQPWLVNALAASACFDNRAGRDRRRAINEADILAAADQLVRSRRTHLDQLTDKLREPRVRRVIEPMLAGDATGDYGGRDMEYVRDLGLIAQDAPPRIANRIYAEVVPRELAWVLQESVLQEPSWYVAADGSLQMDTLLAAFQSFFREHSEHWQERFAYKEAGPQLILQGFLHRIVNGGGRIEREYGLGRGRTDLLVVWPRLGGSLPEQADRHVVECKVRHGALDATIAQGLEQTAAYMDRCSATSGHLVVFDRSERSWQEKLFHERHRHDGHEIAVWGM